MSHEITIRADGFAEAAFAMEPAWHGLGAVLDHAPTSKEAVAAAGLDWRVIQEAVYRKRPVSELTPLTSEYAEVAGHLLNIREDSGLVLGMVGETYRVVQNAEAFEFLDALVEGHEMLYESAFSLYGGRRVVLLARMPGVQTVGKEDHILPYILMSTSHDGAGSIKFGPVATRTVCANTYAVALDEGTTRELAVSHTGDIKAKLGRARAILALASEQFARYAELGRQLAERRLTTDEWGEYLDIMCPRLDPRDPDYTPRRAEALNMTRMQVTSRWVNERQNLEGIEHSAWAAYNAVAEHVDHLPRRGASRRAKSEARFNVTLYGTGRDIKERALRTACKFTGVEYEKAMAI